MTEKENLNPIDLLYRIVSAYPGMEREKAKQSLEEYLSNVPLQEGCSLSEQLPGIVSQYLWESVRPYTLSMNCPVAVDTALADYRKLNSTASPCILRSEEAVQAMEEVKKIASLSGYYKSRDELEQAVYPLSKAESEVVFWHLRGRLEDMLLEVIVPAVLEQEKKPPANLEAQYDLWQDLKQCQRYTVDRFALYFLAIEKGAFRVLLPCCLTHEDGVEQTYRAARIIARLTPQMADGERASLFAVLFLWTEERALRHIGTKKADANTEVMQELYLLLLDSLKRGDYRFWENQRFRDCPIHLLLTLKIRRRTNNMNEKTMSMNSLIPTMQSILYAPNPEELRGAVDTLNATLMTTPVKQVLSQSGQFVDIVEQVLMDAIEDNQDLVLPHTKRECQTALNDWQILRRPVLPAPIMSPAAQTALRIVEDIDTLNNYDAERQVLWTQLQALDDSEQEMVSGHLSQKLSELLIRKMLPEVVRQKEDYALLRQFRLWSQLMDCRKYGMEDLAVYFLQADRDHVKVLLPPAMEYHNAVKDYYGCARTLAVLYYQIPVCQRDALFRSLYKALKDEVLHGVLGGEDSGALDAVQDLYLAMCTEKLTRQLHFWEAMCYTKHALDKNTKNNKEDN